MEEESEVGDDRRAPPMSGREGRGETLGRRVRGRERAAGPAQAAVRAGRRGEGVGWAGCGAVGPMCLKFSLDALCKSDPPVPPILLAGVGSDSGNTDPDLSVAGTAAAVVADAAGTAAAGTAGGSGGGHMVASESLTKLSPGEVLSVLLTVRLPPVQSCTSKLSCCIQDPLLIIALRNVKLSLHCTEPVICLKRISRMGESRWMSLHKVSTSVPLLRLRIGLNILQSLYCIVESSHHLHLKLKRLICCQRWWVLRWVLRWVAISLIPGVYHLLATVETISVSNCCTYPG
ncbi:hypothetical protein U9M48_039753 [Paspalum notatum var. saurae]|uniref:Uncharacterized protein n=1 Tax=Paspalum notatum var. saurae TaxID=547442 RepID=A0AAQ3UJK0_PASNO